MERQKSLQNLEGKWVILLPLALLEGLSATETARDLDCIVITTRFQAADPGVEVSFPY